MSAMENLPAGSAAPAARKKAEYAHLSDALVGGLEIPLTGFRTVWDAPAPGSQDETPTGFGIRLYPGGRRSWIIRYRADGESKLYTFPGDYPDMGTAEARKNAAIMRQRIDAGFDPAKEKSEKRAAREAARAAREAEEAAWTVTDLWKEYAAARSAKTAKPRPWSEATLEENTDIAEGRILPKLGKLKAAAVTRDHVTELHEAITLEGRPVRANRTISVLSGMFNWAITKKASGVVFNPATRIEKNRESHRQRFLKPDEIAALTRALDAHPKKDAANAIRLLLLTGARRGEVLGAQWEQFDLEKRCVWIKPPDLTKQRKEHYLPLSQAALELLRKMKREHDKKKAVPPSPFLFPGPGESGHMEDIKKSWRAVALAAGLFDEKKEKHPKTGKMITRKIVNTRLHDLRHTHASLALNAGLPLEVVGGLLGHADISTTQRYAHLADTTLRNAAEAVGAIVAGAGSSAPVASLDDARKGRGARAEEGR